MGVLWEAFFTRDDEIFYQQRQEIRRYIVFS
jgi:hypothetical protein